jgi:hypothetical protein
MNIVPVAMAFSAAFVAIPPSAQPDVRSCDVDPESDFQKPVLSKEHAKILESV